LIAIKLLAVPTPRPKIVSLKIQRVRAKDIPTAFGDAACRLPVVPTGETPAIARNLVVIN